MGWSAAIDKDDGHLVSAEELLGCSICLPKFIEEPKGGLKLELEDEDGADDSTQ